MSSECANPLLLEWLGEWLETARQRNSKGQQTYKKAYDSMKACPLPFLHPSEAQQLSGLGPKLCDRLTERMRKHCAENGLPMPDMPQNDRKRLAEDVEGASSLPTKRARKPKSYVPFLRSGPYALILALSTLPEESSQGLTKGQLIQLAQPHCDSSFTAPSDPTKFFTAWNSMKTLLEKDLVFERGRPLRKYALTEEGWEVARRIGKAEAGKEGSLGAVPKCVGGKDEGHWVGVGPTRVWVEPETLSDHGKENQPHRPGNQQKNVLGPKSIAEVPAPANPSHAAASRKPHGAPKNKFSWRKVTARQGTISSQEGSDHDNDFMRISSRPLQPTAEQLEDGWHSIDSVCDPTDSPDTAGASVRQSNSREGLEELPPFEPIFLPIGSFTIHLVLDTREIRTKTDRDYMQEELAMKGVPPIVRSLELGDALWVAKCNDSRVLEAYGEEGDEVMLDWIVERKRLDDLVGSIKDGRFQEQKFRLRKSGVQNVVYIIEEISMNGDHWSKWQEAVESAIASTQVVNGYFVKKTQKMDDTIRYLARMTILLKSLYESKPLHIIPSSILSPRNYLPLLTHLGGNQNTNHHHITYPTFASLASKSESLTLRDIFLKMLMCTRGLSGEKALEIQRRWKTPREFVEAFEGLPGDRRGEMVMKASEKVVVGRRKIGRKLSEKIAEVWGGS
ncbi:MAG: Crossover junction endonuclease mus81 [Geoglossum simile]|nr:MAG: Crossover junction endonuclease mus81 [Geoglossum simile]